ncbi:MAG: hypothetical protein ACRYGP_10190 [Janthinobacterium lividum]
MIDPKNEYQLDQTPETKEGEINLDNAGSDDPFAKHQELHRSGSSGR